MMWAHDFIWKCVVFEAMREQFTAAPDNRINPNWDMNAHKRHVKIYMLLLRLCCVFFYSLLLHCGKSVIIKQHTNGNRFGENCFHFSIIFVCEKQSTCNCTLLILFIRWNCFRFAHCNGNTISDREYGINASANNGYSHKRISISSRCYNWNYVYPNSDSCV